MLLPQQRMFWQQNGFPLEHYTTAIPEGGDCCYLCLGSSIACAYCVYAPMHRQMPSNNASSKIALCHICLYSFFQRSGIFPAVGEP